MRRVSLAVLVSVMGVIAVACGGTTTEPAATPGCTGVELLVAASNYNGASLACGAPGCAIGPSTSGTDLGDDPQLATSRGRAFFLARSEDTLFEVDAACGAPTARIDLQDVPGPPGAGTRNPHDAAVAPDGALFVALYGTPAVAVVENGAVTGTIDLSPYDLADGNPQAESIRIVDVAGVPKAFVALEVLDDDDGLRSSRPSSMLRIDVATRVVEAAIPLAGRNPFNPMSEEAGKLFLAVPGNFDDATELAAGIERFDTATSTTALLATEIALGGSVSEVAVSPGCGAAIVAGPAPTVNPTSVVTFDPATGEVLTTAAAPVLGPTPGYDLQGLAFRDGLLYVGDRRRVPGGYAVHVLAVEGRCALRDTGRTLVLPMPAVALRPARITQ